MVYSVLSVTPGTVLVVATATVEEAGVVIVTPVEEVELGPDLVEEVEVGSVTTEELCGVVESCQLPTMGGALPATAPMARNGCR